MNPLYPPAILGVLGGGQLGRMFIREAGRYGYTTHVYNPTSPSPASLSGAKEFIGEFSDLNELEKFLSSIDALTFEFENIPEPTLDFISDYSEKNEIIVSPSPDSIKISNHRIREKNFFKSIGIPTTNYAPLIGKVSKNNEYKNFRFPAILKTNQLGYDGKGQIKFNTEEEFNNFIEGDKLYNHILEEVINFDYEISVIGGRFFNGNTILYSPSLNIHKNHILDVTIHPAGVAQHIIEKSLKFTKLLMDSLNYVGVLGLEFFVRGDELYGNEFAPRPHNSGHYTLDGSNYSQFEVQLLCLTNLVNSIDIKTQSTVMKNIVGVEFFKNKDNYKFYTENSNYKLHLYQKNEILPGRKLGHINYLGDYTEDLFSF